MINLNLNEDETLSVYESLLKTSVDPTLDPLLKKLREILLDAMTRSDRSRSTKSERTLLNEDKFKSWEMQELKKIKELDERSKSAVGELVDLCKKKKKKSRG